MDNGDIRLLNTIDGSVLDRWRAHDGRLKHIRWDDHGTRLLTYGADDQIVVWDISSRQSVFEADVDKGMWQTMALSGDGETVAFWHGAGMTGTAQLWHLENEDSPLVLQPMPGCQQISLSADGSELATAHPGSIRLWSVRDGTELHRTMAKSETPLMDFLFPSSTPSFVSVEHAESKLYVGTSRGALIEIGSETWEPTAEWRFDKKGCWAGGVVESTSAGKMAGVCFGDLAIWDVATEPVGGRP